MYRFLQCTVSQYMTRQVERVTRRVGAERVAERDAAVAAFADLPLVDRFAVPAGVAAPRARKPRSWLP